jgi:hypothetical protein
MLCTRDKFSFCIACDGLAVFEKCFRNSQPYRRAMQTLLQRDVRTSCAGCACSGCRRCYKRYLRSAKQRSMALAGDLLPLKLGCHRQTRKHGSTSRNTALLAMHAGFDVTCCKALWRCMPMVDADMCALRQLDVFLNLHLTPVTALATGHIAGLKCSARFKAPGHSSFV